MIVIEGEASGELDIKRCYLPGIVVRSKCPNCSRVISKDLAKEYLSYPLANEPEDMNFYCEDCEKEWEERVKLTVKLEAAK